MWGPSAASVAVVLLAATAARAFPESAQWAFTLNEGDSQKSFARSVFRGSKLYVQLSCESKAGAEAEAGAVLAITWSVREELCLSMPDVVVVTSDSDNGTISGTTTSGCLPHIVLAELGSKSVGGTPPPLTNSLLQQPASAAKRPIFTFVDDGFYRLSVVVKMETSGKAPFDVNFLVELRNGDGGYLSAADWPLLPFYGIMCSIYVVLGLLWLTVSFLQWRDLLRIQFWIGGVIFLGMLETATFYAEYSSYNSYGTSTPNVVLAGELVACCKRTLARMLVIIVSLGFGIVKPRLGPMLHRVVGVGVLYFLLAATEAYLRVGRSKADSSNQFVVATVPLAVLDSAICWWIFISLSQTMRTLRLRRNHVKFALYRHFTNILIFSVVASVLFMLYSIKTHHLTDCFEDWRELWMDDAYWRLLFSLILVVIMILWRPTNNNQKYAFSPLLDAPDDDDEDEEDQFVNDAFGVKMRGGGASSPKLKSAGATNTVEDDLKWVEENIPASIADGALPILDSDEEIMATRFELSKMQ